MACNLPEPSLLPKAAGSRVACFRLSHVRLEKLTDGFRSPPRQRGGSLRGPAETWSGCRKRGGETGPARKGSRWGKSQRKSQSLRKEGETVLPASVRFAKLSDICLNSGFWLNNLRIGGISLNFRMLLLCHRWRCRDLRQNAVKTIEKGFPSLRAAKMTLGKA